MSKALSQSDITHKAQRWATFQKQIEAAEADREKKLAPINKRFDEVVEPLQSKADALAAEINEWLDKQKKSVLIESRNAIAQVVIGTKLDARKISVKGFLKYAKQKGEAVYDCIRVEVSKAEKLLGKSEIDKISERPTIQTRTQSLRLKD